MWASTESCDGRLQATTLYISPRYHIAWTSPCSAATVVPGDGFRRVLRYAPAPSAYMQPEVVLGGGDQ